MNRRTMMSPGEINNAAYNIREIEKCLGRPLPPGYFDVSNYSERMLTSGEAFTIAHDIKEMERARGCEPPRYNTTPEYSSENSNDAGVLMYLGFLAICGLLCLLIG